MGVRPVRPGPVNRGAYSAQLRGATAWRSVAVVWALVIAALLLLSLMLGGSEPEPPVPAAEPAVTTAAPTPSSESKPDTEGAASPSSWPRPRFEELQRQRDRMVTSQITSGGYFRESVTDAAVLAAMRNVPRHKFVPAQQVRRAYDDTPLAIGYGQTISQPYIVALMTELLAVRAGERVLEIGTGSGYQAAVLAELTPHVYSIEIVEPLAKEATRRLTELGYTTVQTRMGDGYDGWPEHAPFDAIIVTCAAGHVPPPLWEQLKPGGRMVIPVGGVYETQRLLVLTKEADGGRKSRNVLPVRFVPMTGKMQPP